MTTTISQKEYLRKYLSGGSSDKKKKKKKPKVTAKSSMKIIDDDVDISKMRPIEEHEVDLFCDPEDAPQIAGIIDETPEELRYTTDKWKVISQDDGIDSKTTVQQVSKKMKIPNITGEASRSDSDISPPRKNEKSDSDLSPPRRSANKRKESNRKHEKSDSDLSPERKKSSIKKEQRASDSDLSPERKPKDTKTRKRDSDSDLSPVRKKSDFRRKSPNRDNSKSYKKSDYSPPRKRRSPGRDHRSSKRTNKDDFDINPINKHKKNDSDSDLSPVRNSNGNRNTETFHKDRRSQYSRNDQERRSRWNRDEDRRKVESSRRNSVERKRGSPGRFDYKNNRRDDALRKTDKTLDGKKAGLQDAYQLKSETDTMKKREDEMFNKLSDEYTGKHAHAIKRDMRLAKSKKDMEAEKKEQEEREAKQKEMDAKYSRWGRGLKQTEEQEARLKEYIHESSKPLARYRDDQDLDEVLRNKERIGDPMLEYMRRKDKDGDDNDGTPAKPIYKGLYPPNRFNIRPGHRWDGVDRSNGYEKNYFKVQSDKVAREEETYKWSTEDM